MSTLSSSLSPIIPQYSTNSGTSWNNGVFQSQSSMSAYNSVSTFVTAKQATGGTIATYMRVSSVSVGTEVTPVAPQAKAATSILATGFTANWDSTGATSYRLDVSTNPSFTSFLSGYQDKNVGNVTSSAVTGLDASTTYYYRVRSVSNSLTSTQSNTITVTTTAATSTYTITYTLNGGTHGSGHPTSHTYGTATPLVNPTKVGYTFAGWYDNSGFSGSAITSLSATGHTANISLYAKWTANTYTVTYNENGGTGTAMTSSSHTYGVEQNLTTNTYAKTGYTFAGWDTNIAGTTAVYANGESVTNLSATNGAMVTLYAVWTVNSYTITYTLNGGTHGSGYPTSHTYGTATSLVNPTKVGYTFGGWYDNSEFSGSAITSLSATNYTANISLYAKWTINEYTITYFDDEGTEIEITQDYGTSLDKPADPIKTGYNFDGWYLDAELEDEFDFATVPAGNFTLHKKWTAIEYTITYNLDNGTNDSTNPDSYTIETATITLAGATKEGYTFVGWFDALEAGNEVTAIDLGTIDEITFLFIIMSQT